MIPEITPEELVSRVEAGEPIQVLDVRAPERLANGRIDLVPDVRFHNIRGSMIQAKASNGELPINRDTPVAVVCDQGMSSKPATSLLRMLGFEAHCVVGGMARWMHTLIARELRETSSLDKLVQFDRVGKGSLAYLLVSDGEALVIDPPRATRAIEEAVETAGAKIVGFADTHVHADYISGSPSVSQRLGVPYYLHPDDNVYPYDDTPGKLAFEPVHDSSTIEFGRCKVQVFHNPGHTLGSVSFLVDAAAAFTGDFIFVQSLGRPDLGGKAEQWTPLLWASLERARNNWPENITVYPAHYATDEERNEDRSIGRPLSEITASCEPLQITEEAKFTKWVLERRTSFPEAYIKIKAVNVGLLGPSPREADELEVGKNECAVA